MTWQCSTTDSDDGIHLFSLARTAGRVRVAMSSEMGNLSRLLGVTDAFLVRNGFGEFPEFKLLVRELTLNAIRHGNRLDAVRRVRCVLERLDSRTAAVTVEDEGEGFNFSHLDATLPEDPRGLPDRGLRLVSTLSRDLVFRNGGRTVRAEVVQTRQSPFEIEQQDGEVRAVIYPEMADGQEGGVSRLCLLLGERVAAGRRRFVLDCSRVNTLSPECVGELMGFVQTLRTETGASAQFIVSNHDLAELLHAVFFDLKKTVTISGLWTTDADEIPAPAVH